MRVRLKGDHAPGRIILVRRFWTGDCYYRSHCRRRYWSLPNRPISTKVSTTLCRSTKNLSGKIPSTAHCSCSVTDATPRSRRWCTTANVLALPQAAVDGTLSVVTVGQRGQGPGRASMVGSNFGGQSGSNYLAAGLTSHRTVNLKQNEARKNGSCVQVTVHSPFTLEGSNPRHGLPAVPPCGKR